MSARGLRDVLAPMLSRTCVIAVQGTGPARCRPRGEPGSLRPSAFSPQPSAIRPPGAVLEVEPQRELDLAVGAETDRAADGARDPAERAGGACRVRLTRLHLVGTRCPSAFGSVPTGLAKLSRLNRLKISARNSTFGLPRHREALGEHQVDLVERRAVKRAALQVAERARRRRRERRRVQEQQPPSLMYGSTPGTRFGPPHVARRAAARRVDDRRAVRPPGCRRRCPAPST